MIRRILPPLAVILSLLVILPVASGPTAEVVPLIVLILTGTAFLFLAAQGDQLKDLAALYPLVVGLGFFASLREEPTTSENLAVLLVIVLAAGILLKARLFWPRVLAPIGFVLMPALLAFYSSPQGAPGDLAHRIALWLGVSEGAGEAILIGLRKSVHFCFYGSMGLLAWTNLQRRPLLLAVCFVLLHAGFDEIRQSVYASRTGSFWDVLIDLAGALAFIAAARKLGLKPSEVSEQVQNTPPA